MTSLAVRAAAIPAALVIGLAASGSAHAADATPLEQAHAHNDYEHSRPLLDALDQGFTSVEADVWLSDGKLCLGHASPDCSKQLDAKYLAPLEERVAARGGSVYSGWKGRFQLLVELKSDPATTWPAVEKALAAHPRLMRHWVDHKPVDGPVEAVITGRRDKNAMLKAANRWSAYDGSLDDLGSGLSPDFMPMVSGDWWKTFYWRGGYPMPADERAKLRSYADKARAGGYKLRFYGTPDLADPFTKWKRTNVWNAELDAGVGWLNSDDLPGLATYLHSR